MMISVHRVHWEPCWRIIPSRFPPIQLFERVANPADLEAVLAVESLTNDRLRDEVGNLQLVPPAERLSGPGSSHIMAAFTHVNPEGSRFSNGLHGVYYAANTLETAISETIHHREQFLRATSQRPQELDMRVLVADLETALHDIRGMQTELADVYDKNDYSHAQALGKSLRDEGSWGIAYDSVRHSGGECAGIFRPRALNNCRQERHLCYVWDGHRISRWYRKSSLHSRA